jgi:hypothetical protein
LPGRRTARRRPGPRGTDSDTDGERLHGWILAHGSGVDDLLVFASSGALVVAVRLLMARHRAPRGP